MLLHRYETGDSADAQYQRATASKCCGFETGDSNPDVRGAYLAKVDGRLVEWDHAFAGRHDEARNNQLGYESSDAGEEVKEENHISSNERDCDTANDVSCVDDDDYEIDDFDDDISVAGHEQQQELQSSAPSFL
jgi:hypothetical protein